MVDNASNLKENFTANDFIDIKKGINKKETGFNINIPCFKKFKDIFYEVDKLLLKNTNSYTYKEFRGNLSDICHIYLKDKNAVDAMIENGIEITVAIDNAPLAKIDFRMPKYENTEIRPLTTDEKTFMDKTLPIVDRYIKSQPIKNEDILQEIYASYIEKIPEFITKNKSYLNGNGYISGKIYSICKNIHKQAIRKDNIRKLAWNKYDEFFTEIYADRHDTTIENAIHKTCTDDIHYTLHNTQKTPPSVRITEKEIAVLKYRYVDCMTFEQIGKIYDVHRERIRQIGIQAIRKLKWHSSRKKLKHYIEFYNDDYHNEQKTPLWDLLVKK
jgi:DNA-directed RNA polymerase specialized sigma24 family protein